MSDNWFEETRGLELAVDALQQLFGEYASLTKMQEDAKFISEPMVAAELRRIVDGETWTELVDKLMIRANELDNPDDD